MEHNPYQPPGAGVGAESHAPVRRGWVAVVLALVIGPAIAMLYVGRWRRAVAYLVAFVVVLVIAVVVTGMGVPFPAAATASSFALFIVGAVDAARLTRPSMLPIPMPWYSRPPAFVGIAVAAMILWVSLRLFVVQPYQIPSGAMIPNLLVGDVILVNKSAYGLRLRGSPLVPGGLPEHGDVAVFRYPEKPEIDYIKRVIGLPGDTVEYRAKRLYVNGHELARTSAGEQMMGMESDSPVLQQFREIHGSHAYPILHNPEVPAYQPVGVRQFPHRELCAYSDDGFRCTVPDGHYFAMGDNRDSSSDSRYWGFIPDSNLVGRAFVVLCSRGRPGRLLVDLP